MSTSELRHAELRLASGLRLHCVESGDPGGVPILFLHGWPDSWFSYSRVLSLLSNDLRAVTIDQRGFGDSDHPPRPGTIDELAADAIGVLDALGIARATLVGHSYGSFVARQAAITAPRRVARLVLIGTGFPSASPAVSELPEALRDLQDPIPVEFVREFQASTIHRPVPPEFFESIVAESGKIPHRLWLPAIRHLLEHDDSAELVRIEAPTLLVWGDQDALFARDHQERLLASLPSARLRVHEDTGHCPNWERPEDVAADIEAWARRAPPARA